MYIIRWTTESTLVWKEKWRWNAEECYESVKCQYCAAYAKTTEEVWEKFGCKENGDRYRRC